MNNVALALRQTESPSKAPANAASPPAFGARILVGMGGILLAVVIAQINDHVTEIAMGDIRGAMGISHDDASWLSTLYQVTQVSAMMFAPWCAMTFSLRRFTIGAVAVFAVLGLVFPFAFSTSALYVLRVLQGFAGGCLPPMLMTVALRFLPPGIKLYGLGAYALTATFAPNLGTPLAAWWTEYVNWRFLFWEIAPLGLLSILMIAWGLCILLIGAAIMFVLFLVNEWFHPLPFLKIQLLARMNLTHALITLGGVLLIFVAVASVPAAYLAEVKGYRPLQSAPLSLCVALPQLLALPLVAALCNIRAIDCRWILATGIGLIVLTCGVGSYLTSDWVRDNFYVLQIIQIFAQPMAVIPLLMLATNGMAPAEGPFASAWFNTIKGLASVVGTGVTEGFFAMREHFHSNVLVDQLGNRPHALAMANDGFARVTGLPHHAFLQLLDERMREQAMVLASADVFRLMALVAVALIVLIPLIAPRVYPPCAVASNSTR
ncbi:MFS transporter [Paraburkholderia elongata]|uniref:MFS transporter n=1 Tax=Paraburkholderia elongata TaxID=2675747 RepID=A0A972SI62_9BURK|nr:MFS transporter [Paraburkholderia elongata]NPT56653.1 MFS transporter [Paraburkholderia elongata]